MRMRDDFETSWNSDLAESAMESSALWDAAAQTQDETEAYFLSEMSDGESTDVGPIIRKLLDAGVRKIVLPFAHDGQYIMDTPVFWPAGWPYGRSVVIDLNGNTIRLGTNLPTVKEFATDTTTFAFFPNTRRGALSGGVVTCKGNTAADGGGQVCALVLRNGTFEGGTLDAGVVFSNRAPVQLDGVNMVGGKTALSWYDYTDGSQITGNPQFRSATSAGFSSQVPDAWYFWQMDKGDSVFVESLTCVGAVKAIRVRGGAGHSIHAVLGGMLFQKSSSISLYDCHMEADLGDGSTIHTIQNSVVAYRGGSIYRPLATGPNGAIVINDDGSNDGSTVTFDGIEWVTFHQGGDDGGDQSSKAHVWIESVNAGHNIASATEIIAINNTARMIGAGSANAGFRRRTVGVSIRANAALKSVVTALETLATKAIIGSGSFTFDRRRGSWTAQSNGVPGTQMSLRASQPALTTFVANLSAGSLKGTYSYCAAIRDAAGRWTNVSAEVTATPATGVVMILVQAAGPGVVALWRKAGAGVAAAPSHYIELPWSGSRGYVIDEGANVAREPWRAWTGELSPVPASLTVNQTVSELLVDGRPSNILRFVDQDGNPLPAGSATVHINTSTGQIDGITFEKIP